jgi:hypothetical protein
MFQTLIKAMTEVLELSGLEVKRIKSRLRVPQSTTCEVHKKRGFSYEKPL